MEIERYIVAGDSSLVEMVLGGDGHAFEHLFDRYASSLRRIYLQRMGGNAGDTDDLIQDIFIKAYVNLHSYNKVYTFGQWIYTIARNTFIDYVRKRRDDLSIDDGSCGELVRQPASTMPDPEEKILRGERRAQLEVVLERLSPKYRNLIELRFYKDLSYEEISDELKVPLGTVKTRIHRARTQLEGLIGGGV